MNRPECAVTKAQWIEALEGTVGPYISYLRTQQWLQNCMLYYSDTLLDDYRFGPSEMVDFIHRHARREYQDDRGTITYLDYLTEVGAISSEALQFANELVNVCRYVGGDEVAEAVSQLVLADHNAIWRYTRDFLADVFTPLYPLLSRAWSNEGCVMFRLGDVKIEALPMYLGRSHLTISRTSINYDGRQKSLIGLRGGEFKHDGSNLSLVGVYGPSLAEILRMLERATRAYRLLDSDEREQLFSACLPAAASETV